jgi:hypothetical protein
MPKFYCVAEGCTSDTRKKGRYGFMADVKFFPFPTLKQPKVRRKWLDLLRRRDFNPSRHDRVCSRHFIDGEPTPQHPYPELFRYNNYKNLQESRGTSSIDKRLANQQSQPMHTGADHGSDADEGQNAQSLIWVCTLYVLIFFWKYTVCFKMTYSWF